MSKSQHQTSQFEPQLELNLSANDRIDQRIVIKNRKATIGSHPDCSVVLNSDTIQPVHCLVIQGTAGTVVRNFHADTRINGQAFGDQWFSAGDTVTLGSVELRHDHPQNPPVQNTDEEFNSPEDLPAANNAEVNSQELLDLVERLAGLESQLTQLKDSNLEYQQKVVDVENNMVEKLDEIDSLESSNLELRNRIHDIEGYERSIRELEEHARANTQKTDALESKLESKDDIICQFATTNSQLAAELAALRSQLVEVENTEVENTEVEDVTDIEDLQPSEVCEGDQQVGVEAIDEPMMMDELACDEQPCDESACDEQSCDEQSCDEQSCDEQANGSDVADEQWHHAEDTVEASDQFHFPEIDGEDETNQSEVTRTCDSTLEDASFEDVFRQTEPVERGEEEGCKAEVIQPLDDDPYKALAMIDEARSAEFDAFSAAPVSDLNTDDSPVTHTERLDHESIEAVVHESPEAGETSESDDVNPTDEIESSNEAEDLTSEDVNFFDFANAASENEESTSDETLLFDLSSLISEAAESVDQVDENTATEPHSEIVDTPTEDMSLDSNTVVGSEFAAEPSEETDPTQSESFGPECDASEESSPVSDLQTQLASAEESDISTEPDSDAESTFDSQVESKDDTSESAESNEESWEANFRKEFRDELANKAATYSPKPNQEVVDEEKREEIACNIARVESDLNELFRPKEAESAPGAEEPSSEDFNSEDIESKASGTEDSVSADVDSQKEYDELAMKLNALVEGNVEQEPNTHPNDQEVDSSQDSDSESSQLSDAPEIESAQQSTTEEPASNDSFDAGDSESAAEQQSNDGDDSQAEDNGELEFNFELAESNLTGAFADLFSQDESSDKDDSASESLEYTESESEIHEALNDEISDEQAQGFFEAANDAENTNPYASFLNEDLLDAEDHSQSEPAESDPNAEFAGLKSTEDESASDVSLAFSDLFSNDATAEESSDEAESTGEPAKEPAGFSTSFLDQYQEDETTTGSVSMPESDLSSDLATPESKGDETDDSYIQEYMKRLLGNHEEEVVAEVPVESKKEETPSLLEKTFEREIKERQEMLKPSEFIPKTSAPEKNSNLQAMRDLANQSARSAIETSSRKRKFEQQSMLVLIFAGICFFVGASLAMLAKSAFSLPTLGAVVFFALTGIGAWYYFDLKSNTKTNNAADSPKSAKEEDPASAEIKADVEVESAGEASDSEPADK